MTTNNSIGTAFSAVALIGACIGIISIILAWITVSIFFYTESQTGLDLVKNAFDDLSQKDVYVLFMPLVVALLSISGLIGAALSFSKPKKGRGIQITVSGVGVLIAFIIFATYKSGFIEMSDLLGTGAYLAAVGGILLMVGGVGIAATSK